MAKLEGKVAVVTGAGGGLGRAHALLLAQEGASVVVNDLGGDRHGAGAGTSMADAVVDEIIAAGGQAVAHYGSVTNDDDAAGMVAKAVDSFGRLDILINNAGILEGLKTWGAICNVGVKNLGGGEARAGPKTEGHQSYFPTF